MKEINDRIRAKRLLEARKHRFAIVPFARSRALRYLLYGLAAAVILCVLAFRGMWSALGMATSFLLGMAVCYFYWYRGQRRVWPFAERVIDWDLVQKLSEDDSLDHPIIIRST